MEPNTEKKELNTERKFPIFYGNLLRKNKKTESNTEKKEANTEKKEANTEKKEANTEKKEANTEKLFIKFVYIFTKCYL